MLTELPPEILGEIIALAIETPQSRNSILLTNSATYCIGLPVVYQTLVFYSRKQLRSFNAHYVNNKIPYHPRSVVVQIASGTLVAFTDLQELFNILKLEPGAEVDVTGRLILELLRLRMNSFAQSESGVYHALSLINPRAFIWTGPDPPHHFSIAASTTFSLNKTILNLPYPSQIVPNVLGNLVRALETYTSLTHLELANFVAQSNIPNIPSLRRLYLGRVVFLKPSDIAAFVLSPNANNLESLRLVDAYQESIWGPRVRRSDVENAATQLVLGDLLAHQPRTVEQEQRMSTAIGQIRRVVRCEGFTERIIGGDRVSDVLI